jgi:hypothetical protein
MPGWLLKVFHVIGLTNLTDEQVAKYIRLKNPIMTRSSISVATTFADPKKKPSLK